MIGALERIYIKCLALLDRAANRATSAESLVREKWDLRPKGSETLVVFASFDRDARVDDHVVHHLRELRDQLSADVAFVTASAALSDADRERIAPFCRLIVRKANAGLDFGSWKVGLALTADWREYRAIAFVNDSVYGPLFPLDRVRALWQVERPRVVGVTESLQTSRHLQSYFLAFNRAAIASPFFEKFWERFWFYSNKLALIHEQEIGLSRAAARDGAEIVALCPSAEFATASSGPRSEPRNDGRNPTHDDWRATLADFRSPYLKVELMRSNPREAAGLDRVGDLLRSLGSDYPLSLIQRHLERIGAIK